MALQCASVYLGIAIARSLEVAQAQVAGGPNFEITQPVIFGLVAFFALANFLAVKGGDIGPTLLVVLALFTSTATIVSGIALTDTSTETRDLPYLAGWIASVCVWFAVTSQAAPALAMTKGMARF